MRRFCQSRRTQSRRRVLSEGGRQNSQLGGSEAGGECPAVSSPGSVLGPNARILDHVDLLISIVAFRSNSSTKYYHMCWASHKAHNQSWSRFSRTTMSQDLQIGGNHPGIAVRMQVLTFLESIRSRIFETYQTACCFSNVWAKMLWPFFVPG